MNHSGDLGRGVHARGARLIGAGVAGLAAVATVPRALATYGFFDSARSAAAGERLWKTGTYIPSRLPGNPAIEYLLALVVPWAHWIGANLTSVVGYVAAVAAFHQLVKDRFKDETIRRRVLLGTFALTPLLLVDATRSVDFAPGLAAALWAVVFAGRRQWAGVAIMLALAVGFRLPNVLFCVPIALLAPRVHVRRLTGALALGVAAGLCFYIPIFERYGRRTLTIPGSTAVNSSGYVVLLGYRALTTFGPVATAGVLLLLFAARQEVIGSLSQVRRDRALAADLAPVVLFALLFVRHPDESDYLLPIVPFALLLLGRWLALPRLVASGVLIALFGVFTFQLLGGESGRRHVTFRPGWGIVAQDWIDLREVDHIRRGLSTFPTDRPAVIVTGDPDQLTLDNPEVARASSTDTRVLGLSDAYVIKGSQVYVVPSVSLASIHRLTDAGVAVWYFSRFAPGYVRDNEGFDITTTNARRLCVFSRTAFYRLPATSSADLARRATPCSAGGGAAQ